MHHTRSPLSAPARLAATAAAIGLVIGAMFPAAGADPGGGSAPSATGVVDAVRRAAAAYAAAFNAGDDAALAAQWTLGAELEEGGRLVKGREAIVASLRQSRAVHQQPVVRIDVTDVQPLGEGVARVQGTLEFTGRPDQEPVVSRFDSLRVLENGAWRIAESRVVPTPRAALADLDWMVGTWQAANPKTGTTIDATYERALGGHVLIGRVKTTRKDGSTVESLDLIHPDRLAGRVRSWGFDSLGGSAQGTFMSDGTSVNRSLVGTPGDPAAGSRNTAVQVMTPLGRDMLLWHTIERSIDGRPEPDTEPVHLRRVR